MFGFLGSTSLGRTTATALCAALTVFAVVTLHWFAQLWTAQGIYADEHHTGGEIPAAQLWQAAGCAVLVVVGLSCVLPSLWLSPATFAGRHTDRRRPARTRTRS